MDDVKANVQRAVDDVKANVQRAVEIALKATDKTAQERTSGALDEEVKALKKQNQILDEQNKTYKRKVEENRGGLSECKRLRGEMSTFRTGTLKAFRKDGVVDVAGDRIEKTNGTIVECLQKIDDITENYSAVVEVKKVAQQAALTAERAKERLSGVRDAVGEFSKIGMNMREEDILHLELQTKMEEMQQIVKIALAPAPARARAPVPLMSAQVDHSQEKSGDDSGDESDRQSDQSDGQREDQSDGQREDQSDGQGDGGNAGAQIAPALPAAGEGGSSMNGRGKEPEDESEAVIFVDREQTCLAEMCAKLSKLKNGDDPKYTDMIAADAMYWERMGDAAAEQQRKNFKDMGLMMNLGMIKEGLKVRRRGECETC